MTATMKKIVIIGGGAGGLELATSLGHKLGRKKKAEIILVDRNHSHLWKPLLHEVATGSLDDGVDALSYLAHARNHGFNFQIGSLTNIDRDTQTLQLAEIRDEKNGEVLVPAREIAYDTLVMALAVPPTTSARRASKRTASSWITRIRRTVSITKCSTCSSSSLLTQTSRRR
ncbi:NADH dehydrogenase [Ewingella americana]|uniref:NADH dehydrogenase n=1 Tax=Ewingella americana TaxID=41202 RepID=A0A377NDK6_9GAMM|nr:NADH dehydrogenase [Ewingella americana]